jgi:hypothetical protein
MCASPAIDANYGLTWHHSVQLHGLVSGEWYWYCPEASKYCSRFRAALRAGEIASFFMVFFGDMGVGGFKHVKTPGCGPNSCQHLFRGVVEDSICLPPLCLLVGASPLHVLSVLLRHCFCLVISLLEVAGYGDERRVARS